MRTNWFGCPQCGNDIMVADDLYGSTIGGVENDNRPAQTSRKDNPDIKAALPVAPTPRKRKENKMRKINVTEFVTLDGVMQAPGGPDEDTSGSFKYGGWTVPYFDEFLGNVMDGQMSLERSELLLGQKTYEIFAGYWPHHADDWPGINEVRKYVASHDSTLKLDWENSVLLAGNVAEEVKKLKSEDGPDLHVWGSGNLLQTLLTHELVDELWLKVFPITLGTGKRLFSEGTIPAAFRLVDSKVSPKGVIVATYERAGEVKTGSF